MYGPIFRNNGNTNIKENVLLIKFSICQNWKFVNVKYIKTNMNKIKMQAKIIVDNAQMQFNKNIYYKKNLN